MLTSSFSGSGKKGLIKKAQNVFRPLKSNPPAKSAQPTVSLEPYRPAAVQKLKSAAASKNSPAEAFITIMRNLLPFPEKHPSLDKSATLKKPGALLEAGRKPPLILVAGLGNVQFQDDGFGVHVIRELQKDPIPKVVYAEIGTAVLGALHLFEWPDKILAIDAMQAGGKPGSIYTVGINDIERPGPRASLHQQALLSAFKFLSRKTPPEISILGIEPENTAYGLDLSPSVQTSLSRVIQDIKKIIHAWLK